MILFIILGVVLTVLLALAIIKYIPVKFTPIISLVLVGAAGFLSYLIYTGIMEPIEFHEIKKERYAKVIKQLKMIADAQDAHNTIAGKFNQSGEDLIKFVDTAKFAITDTHTVIVQENKGTSWNPLMVEVEKKVTDTVGYELVKDRLFKGRDYKNMLAVPNTNKQFKIETSAVIRANKILASVFQVVIDKADVLEGLSVSLIKAEKEALGGDEIPGGFIALGSLNEVSVNGNWPPLYDAMNE
ncbi:hypothetical protein N9901_01190 [Flavobacteriaceae bacterium]|nr:hypothetical protein [Flavobacteriaceae bacterium]